MKGRQIILDHIGKREAAALMVDGQLQDFLIEDEAPGPGTIYRAVALRPMKGQGGMFLDTPDGRRFCASPKVFPKANVCLCRSPGLPNRERPFRSPEKFFSKAAMPSLRQKPPASICLGRSGMMKNASEFWQQPKRRLQKASALASS